MSNLVHGLAFRTPKFYIVLFGKLNQGLVNLSCNCDVKLMYYCIGKSNTVNSRYLEIEGTL